MQTTLRIRGLYPQSTLPTVVQSWRIVAKTFVFATTTGALGATGLAGGRGIPTSATRTTG